MQEMSSASPLNRVLPLLLGHAEFLLSDDERKCEDDSSDSGALWCGVVKCWDETEGKEEMESEGRLVARSRAASSCAASEVDDEEGFLSDKQEEGEEKEGSYKPKSPPLEYARMQQRERVYSFSSPSFSPIFHASEAKEDRNNDSTEIESSKQDK